MNIKKIIAFYFSPNKPPKKIIHDLAKSMGNYEVEEIDLTLMESGNKQIKFNQDELVVIGLPAYGNRLPALSGTIFEIISGNHTPTVAVMSSCSKIVNQTL